MRDLVAIAASREFGHNAFRMLVSMAILALRHVSVLFLVTEGAVQRVVQRRRRVQKIECGFVARGAVFGFNLIGIPYHPGHMRLMALAAVGGCHVRGVRLVTLRTRRFLAVNAVAGGAELSGVFAPVLTKLLDLGRMAREAGVRQRCGKSYPQGFVRIGMTIETPLEIIVRLALVALAALRNIVL